MKKFPRILLAVVAIMVFASLAFAAPKVGIITPTTSQGEEEYRAAEEMIKKFGKDRIIHVTYPDKFMDEQETTIQQIVTMAADKDVKAIVMGQGYPGTAAAIDKVHAVRPDIIFINVVPHEEPVLAASKSLYCLETDNPVRGRTIIALSKKMGAKTFVHYSFPRHMSYPLLAERRDIFEAECKKQGLKFVFVNAPDPTGDAGIAGAQQFILEDVPRQVAKYGKDTAFFSTNCGMQEPLIKATLKSGAIFPEQCCPSPYHAYPGALGIAIPEGKAGDVDYIIKAIDKAIVEQGGAGRFATWRVPSNMAMMYSAVDYGFEYGNGKIDNKLHKDLAIKLLSKYAGKTEARAYKTKDGKTIPNFILFVGDSIIFGKK